MAYDAELADRIRGALAKQSSTREVPMFGGLCFMVNEKLTVGANSAGELLVRCTPERVDELLTRKGAQWAEMGKGRLMSKGWLRVADEGIANDEDFDFWIQVALEYNQQSPSKGGSRRRPEKPNGR